MTERFILLADSCVVLVRSSEIVWFYLAVYRDFRSLVAAEIAFRSSRLVYARFRSVRLDLIIAVSLFARVIGATSLTDSSEDLVNNNPPGNRQQDA